MSVLNWLKSDHWWSKTSSAKGENRSPHPQSGLKPPLKSPVEKGYPAHPHHTTATTSKRERVLFLTYAEILQYMLFNAGISARGINIARAPRYASLDVSLSDPTQLDKVLKLAEPLALQVRVENVLATRDFGVIRFQVQLDRSMWQSFTRNDLSNILGVGVGEGRREVIFDFVAPHTLVAGRTDSGKTETLKTIITALCSAHQPHELKIGLADPHGDYDNFDNLAHLVGNIAQTDEEIDTLLRWFNKQLAHRRAEKIKDGPKLILALDELPAVTERSAENALIIDQISDQGRKFQIHLLGGVQRPNRDNLKKVTNFGQRFIGQLGDAQESAFVSGFSGLNAHKLSGRGDFIHLAGGKSRRFQVALTTQDDLNRLPRMECTPLQVDNELKELPPEQLKQEADKGGRPRNELQPDVVALLLWRGHMSRSEAQETFALTEYALKQHKKFVKALRQNILYLASQEG